jgi:phage baseplate assembly protein gpV
VKEGSLRWGIVGATDPSKIARGREGRVGDSAVVFFDSVRERKDQATKGLPQNDAPSRQCENPKILEYRTGAGFSVEREAMRHLYRVPLHSLVQVMWSLARLAR